MVFSRGEIPPVYDFVPLSTGRKCAMHTCMLDRLMRQPNDEDDIVGPVPRRVSWDGEALLAALPVPFSPGRGFLGGYGYPSTRCSIRSVSSYLYQVWPTRTRAVLHITRLYRERVVSDGGGGGIGRPAAV